jgi:CheY-like chemotaxis protein
MAAADGAGRGAAKSIRVRFRAGSSHATGRILLADDNADMRQYVRRLLGDYYEIHEVSNGREALAAIKGFVRDLVLADVMMPELDGFGLLRELGRNESTRAIPVILLSARPREDARIEWMEIGADDSHRQAVYGARASSRPQRAHHSGPRTAREAVDRERALRAGLELRVRERTGELQSSNRELRELSSRLEQSRDEERRRLARDLHDSAGQLLAAIAMNVAAIKRHASEVSEDVAKRTDEAASMIDQLSTEIRTISHLLHPSAAARPGRSHLGSPLVCRRLCGAEQNLGDSRFAGESRSAACGCRDRRVSRGSGMLDQHRSPCAQPVLRGQGVSGKQPVVHRNPRRGDRDRER